MAEPENCESKLSANKIFLKDAIECLNIESCETLDIILQIFGNAICNALDTEMCDIVMEQKEAFELLGDPLTFTSPDYGTEVDIIEAGVTAITRGDTEGIFNPLTEGSYIGGTSPGNTEWNTIYTDPLLYGFTSLGNVQDRVFADFETALNGDPFNFYAGLEIVMHDLTTDKYYTFTFTEYSEDGTGGGFEYTRQEFALIAPCSITFSDGSVLTSAANILTAGDNINVTQIINVDNSVTYVISFAEVINVTEITTEIINAQTIITEEIDVCDINLTPQTFSLDTEEIFNVPGEFDTETFQTVGPAIIVPGVLELSRATSGGAWYNSVSETFYNFPSPADTEWNSQYTDGVLNGHTIYDNLEIRTYDNFQTACAGQIGNVVVGLELVCHIISTNQYFLFTVTSWDSGGGPGPYGGFAGTYQEVIPSELCVITFSDGTTLNSAPEVVIDTDTWSIPSAAFVDANNGDDTTAVLGDGNKPYKFISSALLASDFIIVKPCTTTEQVSITTDNKHIYCMPGVVFTSGGFVVVGTGVNKFRVSGSAVFTGFFCSVIRAIGTNARILIDFDYADNIAKVAFNESPANNPIIIMNANWILCHCYNGAGYAVRCVGGGYFEINIKDHFHTQHTTIQCRDGFYGKVTLTCPDVRVIPNYTTNFGNVGKIVLAMDSTLGAYIELNGNITNTHNVYNAGNGIITMSNLIDADSKPEVVINGHVDGQVNVAVLSEFISATGFVTFNGDVKSLRTIFATTLTGWANPSDQRFYFNGSIIQTGRSMILGRGRTFYFKDCSLYNTEDGIVTPGSEHMFTAAEPGLPASNTQVYMYNCIVEMTGAGATLTNVWSGSYSLSTINTPGNKAIGGAVADAWTGYTVVPTLTVPKK